jgi:hypothetical protein
MKLTATAGGDPSLPSRDRHMDPMELPVEILIDEAYAADDAQFPSRTISAGIIGNPCLAFIELNLRSYPDDPPKPKTRRIFRDGHRIEEEVLKDLRKAGMNIVDRDYITGKQITYLAYGGHIKAKVDGLIERSDASVQLLEIKSMNEANWNKFKKSGLRVSHPKYVSQVMLEMGMSGVGSALVVAYNKNTSEYHSEVIRFDEFEYHALMHRAETVLHGGAERISADKDDWRCRGCFKKSACWSGEIKSTSCRNCKHSSPDPRGWWTCSVHNAEAKEVCPSWELFSVKEKGGASA